MATNRNVNPVNSPNTNNNNNNYHHPSSPLTRDTYDYSPTKYNQQPNSKTSTMPKHHYQNTTTTTTNKRDFIPAENGNNHLVPSDTDSNTSSNEPTKRIADTNGKFSIQKMIRQGFSSWRTRRKPPSLSTPPPQQASISTNTSTPPSPPSSTGHYMSSNDDPSQTHPSTSSRSVSVDSISNRTTPQRIIVTEQIAFSPARSNSVDSVTTDVDRPPTNTRGYIQSPWATTESTSRPASIPSSRILPVQFSENKKAPAPPPPPPPSAYVNVPSMTETTPSTIHPSRIPPPGMILLDLSLSK
jgi:hypothetical protein